jgi:hypothetical protein
MSLITTEAEVRLVKAPAATATWYPFPHSILLDELEKAAEVAAVQPTQTRYELSKDGLKFFGVWIFQNGNKEVPQVSIGFRNSIDKSMAIGLTAGTYVTVCSNMAFNGQWMQFRKHTKNVLEDLKLFIQQAFARAIKIARRDIQWQQRLDVIDLTPDDWKILTYDALDSGVVAPAKSAPLFDFNGKRSLGNWFNVITNVLSNRSLIYTEQNFAQLRFMVEHFLDPEGFGL